MLDWIIEPYELAFMQRALVAAVAVGLLAPLVGAFVVLRRLAYLSDAMSHATLGGVAIAYVAGVSVTVGALAAGVAMAVLMGVLAAHPRLREDSIVGVVGAGMFAVGVLVIARADAGIDLTHYLFGSVTSVSWDGVALQLALGGGAALVLLALLGDLRAASFDQAHAQLTGVPVGALRLVLFCALAATIVVALDTVGLLMTVTLVVIPAATARLWCSTVERMCALGSAIGAGASATGLTLAYHLATPPGATIALCCVAILGVSFAVTLPRRGPAPAEHAPEAMRPGPAGALP